MGQHTPSGKIFFPEDLKELLAQGHELGCHTFGHCHSWETMSPVFEKSIIENRRALDELIPGASFKTLSYPISCPRPQTKRRIAKYFICCRGGGQTFNVGRTDLNHVCAYFLEKRRNDPESIKKLIDENCRALGWLIFATHDICETHTPFGCTPGFFEDIVRSAVNSGSRILPVAQACETIVSGGLKT
jgi:peptidoglycan/xylan/chitin deacetylase (PgdA/CDA1 family)